VGELDDYSFYNPLGDEADFNLYIFPDQSFRFLISDVRAMMSADERGEIHRRRRGDGLTMEAEITPDEEYYNNFYFPTEEGRQTQLEGAKVGVYGPWVRDLSHGGRPEIHPSEAIWFRTGDAESLAGPGRVRHVRWTLIVLQDDSNRFDRPSDYDINIFNPGDLANLKRPWSASPRRARFTIALLGLRGQAVNYNLKMQDGHRVFAWPGEDSRSVTATAQDLSTVTVTKAHSRRAEFKVRLGRLAPDPRDANVLHCFMSLDVQVGEGDRGKEGFAEMSLEAWAPGTGPGSGGGDGANSGGRPGRPQPGDRPRPGGRPHQPGDGPSPVEP
jgi:hypothetical protein